MKVIEIHPVNPQARWIKQIAEAFQKGCIVIYPTSAGYAIGCDAENKKAISRLYSIQDKIKKPLMALMFQNISDITTYARVDNLSYRLLKEKTPGPYTFILPAQVHISRLLGVKRPEIGVRIPNHPFLIELLKEWKGPILNSGARLLPDEDYTDPKELEVAFRGKADLLVSCGIIQVNPTNVISLVNGYPEVIRGTL